MDSLKINKFIFEKSMSCFGRNMPENDLDLCLVILTQVKTNKRLDQINIVSDSSFSFSCRHLVLVLMEICHICGNAL